MVSCENCYKYYNERVITNCSTCKNASLSEALLCELLQLSNDNSKKDIECFSYRPNLSIIGTEEKKHENITQEENEEEISLSNKSKWLKAYALQQWENNPDEILFNFNFHVCLITKNRETEFLTNTADNIMSLFSQSASLFKDTQIEILSMSLDHIHMYIISSPDYSIDEIINKSIDYVEQRYEENTPIFERSYFAESIS